MPNKRKPNEGSGGEIVRVTHDRKNPYVMVQRALGEDSRLSFQARGLMLYLLSKPDDWEVRMRDLEREGQLGRFAVRSILRELTEAGYLLRERTHTAAGHWQWISHIYENPADVPAEPSVNDRPMVQPPMVQASVTEQPIYQVVTVPNNNRTKEVTEPVPPESEETGLDPQLLAGIQTTCYQHGWRVMPGHVAALARAAGTLPRWQAVSADARSLQDVQRRLEG